MMHTLFCLLLLSGSAFATAYTVHEPPQQALNQYVAFLNHSVDQVISRFQILQDYHAATVRYRSDAGFLLKMPSSGPLEGYYYKQALDSSRSSLTPKEIQRLNAGTKVLRQRLEKIDQTGKALETYVRLKDYQRDGLKRSDALLAELQALVAQFSQEKGRFYAQIQRVYRRYQPYLSTDAYLHMEKEMTQILAREQQTLEAWPYYFQEETRTVWPEDSIRQSMLADQAAQTRFGKAQAAIAYPASGMVASFKAALQAIQDLKGTALNDYTFAARQSARHGNAVYLALINHVNNDLLANYQAFVKYSLSEKRLLDYPKFCPVFVLDTPQLPRALRAAVIHLTEPFRDAPLIAFTTKPSVKPAEKATFQALTGYVEFINESLRQMNHLQVGMRDYQSSAEGHRDPEKSRQRGNLTYTHEDFKIPVSDYELLISNSQHIPVAYRVSIHSQAEVLMNMLKEMNALSIELIAYTGGKHYEQDGLEHSDAILDRYADLFELFDQKKEQLYYDVRRIHESYKLADPTSSWFVAARAMLNAIDEDHAVLFGIKDYLKGQNPQLPAVATLEAAMRSLLTDEYQNLKGLTRYGRSNGLCPYSPYEDLAENSGRFAEKTQGLKTASLSAVPHPYESFYYFYNNELIYPYNKFSELAGTGVLKTINQPNLFAFRRERTPPKPQALTAVPNSQPEAVTSLTGYAPNNMVLLLDVSASMDSPYKMPLLKKSIKSLLPLLRPQDRIAIVVYSGKARLVLASTSGVAADKIARTIDQLKSSGETDGNRGIRLAYEVAMKQYLPSSNNRIILATDGEFPIQQAVYKQVAAAARQDDVCLTVFMFSENEVNAVNLKKIAMLGRGRYEHVTSDKANQQLILEAQAKKVP